MVYLWLTIILSVFSRICIQSGRFGILGVTNKQGKQTMTGTTENTLPEGTAAPTEAGGIYFWNAYQNIRAEIQTAPGEGYDFNRELITYIQADPRYPVYLDMYLKSDETTSAERKAEILAEGQAAHLESDEVLNTTPGYSTDMQGLANDFFTVIEREDMRVVQLGALAAPPAPVTEIVESSTDTAEVAAVTEVAAVDPVDPETTLVTAPMAVEDAPEPIVMAPVTVTADIPEDETVTATVEEPEIPVIEEPKPVVTHTVASGDSIWEIAQEHYGIERGNYESNAAYTAAIQNAVSHIASATGLVTAPNGKNYDLTVGANAGHIHPGQVLTLPPAEELANEPTHRLNFASLDAGGRVQYSAAVITPTFNTEASRTSVVAPALVSDLNYTRAMDGPGLSLAS